MKFGIKRQYSNILPHKLKFPIIGPKVPSEPKNPKNRLHFYNATVVKNYPIFLRREKQCLFFFWGGGYTEILNV